MTEHDDIRLIALDIAEMKLGCPATAMMSETDQEIWLYITKGARPEGAVYRQLLRRSPEDEVVLSIAARGQAEC